jgi:cytochrome b pre-mRNA-processing protein 3
VRHHFRPVWHDRGASANTYNFYRDCAVPNTLNGRFELIVLHMALLLDRLAQDPALRHLERTIFDHSAGIWIITYTKWASANSQRRPRFGAWGRPSMAVCKPTGWHWRRPDDDTLAEAVARNILA